LGMVMAGGGCVGAACCALASAEASANAKPQKSKTGIALRMHLINRSSQK